MDQREIELLIAEHELWFSDHSKGNRLCIVDAELKRLTFANRFLPDIVVRNSKFEQCNVEDAEFLRATMESVCFTNCECRQLQLSDSTLTGCQWNHALLQGSRFDGANITNCSFEYADLRESMFVKAMIGETSFAHCDFSEANMRRCLILNGDLSHSKFAETDLQKSTLTRVDLRFANLCDSGIDFARIDHPLVYEAHGTPALFEQCKIVDPDFSSVGDGSDIRSGEEFLEYLRRQDSNWNPLNSVVQ